MIISKQQLVSNILTELSDNSTGSISPYDIRHNLIDIVDSAHLLLVDKDLSTNNFASLDTRVTKAGKETLKNYFVTNSINEDNSAFGYSALRNNFQGVKNTAIGSSALSCNVYGGDNVALGYKAVEANTTGYGNIGIGNYTLETNKFGHYNIAIGNAAGYYIGRNESYKLYIAAHPIDNTYICDNPLGSGLTPLVHGDLSGLKFGIAVNDLHGDGTLQVSGAIAPSENAKYNLGSPSYQFNRVYFSSGITFPSGTVDFSYALSGIAVSGNVVPLLNNYNNLGTHENRWSIGYFDKVISNVYETVSTCAYECKTLHLGSSGVCEVDSPCGYLSDQELEDAGFLIQSSGSNNSYRRNYYFQFKPQNNTLTCLEEDNVYSRSSWNTNISIHISGGSHLQTDRVIGSGGLSLVTQPDCLGIFIKDDNNGEKVYIAKEPGADHSCAGVGNVNFLYGSVNDVAAVGNYTITYGAYQPGVDIAQRFLTNTKVNQIDSETGLSKLSGFEIKCFDDSDISYEGPLSDRFTINSFDATSEPVHSLVMLKGGDSDGVLGINDFGNVSHLMLPSTTLNVRSNRDSIIRSTAESDGYYKSSLQLLGHDNCLNSGIEISYYNNSGIADISMYKDSGQNIFIRMDEDGKIGFFAVSGQMNDMITIGGSGYNQAVVSIKETVGNVSSTEKYGKIFTKEYILSDTQSSTLYFLDSSGNLFNLVENKYDSTGGSVYVDENRNTLVGINSNTNRTWLDDFGAFDNTAYGYAALSELASGDRNTVIGSFAAQTLTSGVSNIVIGYKAMRFCDAGVSGNIIIGNDSLGENIETDNTFLIGNGSYPLLSGDLSSNNRHLFLPNGKMSIENSDTTESLVLQNNVIEVVDEGGDDYPQNQLTFKFTGNNSADLLVLKHSGVPLSNTPTYEFADSGIPYAELRGDLRLQNAIRFSDNTSLSSFNEIAFASGLAIQNSNALSSLVIEGVAQQNISIGSFNTASSGIIRTRGGSDVYVYNRDQFLQINVNDFVIALKIDQEYRPLWVSSESTACQCCNT